MKPIVIFGAGKIARGFVNHLLSLSGYSSVFVEKAPELCQLINERKSYTIHVLGNEAKDMVIPNASAICLDDMEQVAQAVSETELVFTAVGGKNLTFIVPALAEGIRRRFRQKNFSPLNIITCENWKKPADILKNGVKEILSQEEGTQLEQSVGFTESVVMRSAIEPDSEALKKDPLIVNVQDFWSLPVDGDRLAGEIPEIQYLEKMENFGGFLERKFYTYNAANGTVSYVGSALGYTHIAPASRDTMITGLLEKVYAETTEALCRKHGTPLKQQQAFAQSSLRKLRDEKIVDTLERNARDPIRKLSSDDRLIGSARLMMEYGVKPDGILTSIACAIFYNGPDESALKLQAMRKEEGVDVVLTKVCGLDLNGELAKMIKERITKLAQEGIIKNDEAGK